MGFFTWLLIFFLSFWLITRFFGKYIMKFLLTSILKQVAKSAERQSQAFQQNYESQAFRESVHVDDHMKVSKPKHEQKKQVDPDDFVEDVEFEEM